jgi:hypothetical protein
MSNPLIKHDSHDSETQPQSGPNLVLLFSIVALALAAAIAIAMMIVYPFYIRR